MDLEAQLAGAGVASNLLPRWSSDWLNVQKPDLSALKTKQGTMNDPSGEVFCVDAARMSRIWMGKLDENGDKPW